MKQLLQLLVIPLALVVPACASDTYTLTVQNRTEVILVPYPVVANPPPPHREADLANTLPHGGDVAIDVDGFNPVFYNDRLSRGLTIQMALGDTPPTLLVRVYEYVVPPGQEGPTTQPTLLNETLFEPTKSDLILVIGLAVDGFPVTFSES